MLLPADRLAERVEELARELDQHYSGREIVVIIVLRGAFVFAADLIRHLKTPVEVDFICLESYGEDKCSSGSVKIRSDVRASIEDREVLVIEDIVDTGYSADFVINYLYDAGARDVKFIALLDKPSRREIEVDIDFVGFTIPNVFVVGYGIDYAQKYRNLPDIKIIKEAVEA